MARRNQLPGEDILPAQQKRGRQRQPQKEPKTGALRGRKKGSLDKITMLEREFVQTVCKEENYDPVYVGIQLVRYMEYLATEVYTDPDPKVQEVRIKCLAKASDTNKILLDKLLPSNLLEATASTDYVALLPQILPASTYKTQTAEPAQFEECPTKTNGQSPNPQNGHSNTN